MAFTLLKSSIFNEERHNINVTDLQLEVARRALQAHGTTLPPKEMLYQIVQGECPRCAHIGNIAEDFGFKVVKGEPRPQSYCRPCRNQASTESRKKRKSGKRKHH